MSIVVLAASPSPALQGVHVGAAALAIGVVIEAVASRWMTREIVSKLLDGRLDRASTTPLTLRAIASFYLPLALTSVFAMAIQPMVTFFMAQSRFPLESLAVLPVIYGLTFSSERWVSRIRRSGSPCSATSGSTIGRSGTSRAGWP